MCACFVPHPLTLEQREDRVTSKHYHDGQGIQTFFLTELLQTMRPGVLPMTPKQSNRVLNGLVRHPLS